MTGDIFIFLKRGALRGVASRSGEKALFKIVMKRGVKADDKKGEAGEKRDLFSKLVRERDFLSRQDAALSNVGGGKVVGSGRHVKARLTPHISTSIFGIRT